MADGTPLGNLLERALDDVGPVAVDGLAPKLDARRARARRRRVVGRAVPIGAAAAVLVIVVAILVRQEPAAQQVTTAGGRFALVGPPPLLTDVLEATRLAQRFAVFDSTEQAIQNLRLEA